MDWRLTFFHVFLSYNCYALMILMLGCWCLVRAWMNHLKVKFQEERVLGRSPNLWRILGGSFLLLVCFILIHGGVLQSTSLTPYAPVLSVVIYPLCVGLVMWWAQFCGAFWILVLEMLSPFRNGGPNFRDGFMADILTSLSKVTQYTLCSCVRWGTHNKDIDKEDLWHEKSCGDHKISSYLMILPYLLRLVQCLGEVWYKTGILRTYAIMNAVKYLLSILMIIFSVLYVPHTHHGLWFYLWIIVSVISSVYSFVWDLWRDWQLDMRFGAAALRPAHPAWKIVFYSLLILFDLLGRFSWTYRLFRWSKYSLVVFCVAAFEVIRRSVWMYFRVECKVMDY